MGPIASGLQLVPGPACHHVTAVRDVVLQHRLEAQHLRPPIDDREHQRAERHLQLGVLVEVVEHRVRPRVRLELDHDAHLVLAPELVVEVGDAVDLAVVDELRDRLHEAGLVHLVGKLADDDLLPAGLQLLEVDLGAHDDASVPRAVDVGDVARVDDPAGGEVRALDDADEILGGGLGIVDEADHRVAHLAEIVWRDVGRHAHRDAAGAVDQQVGKQGGHHERLTHARHVGEVRAEVDRILLDVVDEAHRHRGHPRLGVPVRGGRVTVDRPEVPLPVDERIAHHPRLREPHQRVVDGGVAVGMVLAEHFADDRRALLVARTGGHPGVEHRPENPSLRGFEPVADVGQRAADDDAHRVVHVGRAHLRLELDRVDLSGFEHRHGYTLTSERVRTAPAMTPLTPWSAARAATRIAFIVASASERPCAITTSPATPSRSAPPVFR